MELTKEQGSAAVVQHAGPNLGVVATVYMMLFLAGLWPVTTMADKVHFPRPWESGPEMVSYFQTHQGPVLWCAFLQFGALIALGVFTATAVSRLHFLGVRAAGATIALFGGLATVFNGMAASAVIWALVQPGIAQDESLVRGLYYVSFAFGGPGFSVPMGLLIAGISIPAAFMKLLPKWMVVLGLLLAVCGELSWLDMIEPKAVFLVPLTRFPSFLWLIAAGFLLPKGRGKAA